MGKKNKYKQLNIAGQRVRRNISAMMDRINETTTSIRNNTDEIIRVNRAIRENWPLPKKPQTLAKRIILTLVK